VTDIHRRDRQIRRIFALFLRGWPRSLRGLAHRSGRDLPTNRVSNQPGRIVPGRSRRRLPWGGRE